MKKISNKIIALSVPASVLNDLPYIMKMSDDETFVINKEAYGTFGAVSETSLTVTDEETLIQIEEGADFKNNILRADYAISQAAMQLASLNEAYDKATGVKKTPATPAPVTLSAVYDIVNDALAKVAESTCTCGTPDPVDGTPISEAVDPTPVVEESEEV